LNIHYATAFPRALSHDAKSATPLDDSSRYVKLSGKLMKTLRAPSGQVEMLSIKA
jgi:hypothetical protein